MRKNTAIILGAGKGSRMNLGYNKQFLEIDNEPIIIKTIRAFQEHSEINDIYIVASVNDKKRFNTLLNDYKFGKVRGIVEGGKERSDSVLNGLELIESCDVVLIHDGARPFVSKELISKGIEYAMKYKAAAPAVKIKDTIKKINNKSFAIETVDRETLVSIQTPQCFIHKDILRAQREAKDKNIALTDDTSAIELLGIHSYIYEGDYNNIKITTVDDIILAENILKAITN